MNTLKTNKTSRNYMKTIEKKNSKISVTLNIWLWQNGSKKLEFFLPINKVINCVHKELLLGL